jgi:predicted Ser/Thr protein kinase
MRFQDNLLLQKKHAEDLERQMVAQKILDDASATIQSVYHSRKKFRDPIEESKARIKAWQRRAASTSAGASQQITAELVSKTALSQNGSGTITSPSGQAGQQHQDYVTREVTVRHLNNHANLNPTAFKLYRKLRFG